MTELQRTLLSAIELFDKNRCRLHVANSLHDGVASKRRQRRHERKLTWHVIASHRQTCPSWTGIYYFGQSSLQNVFHRNPSRSTRLCHLDAKLNRLKIMANPRASLGYVCRSCRLALPRPSTYARAFSSTRHKQKSTSPNASSHGFC